jgi:uncharacterized membrane protein
MPGSQNCKVVTAPSQARPSPVMVIVRKVTPDKFPAALQRYGGTVLRTSLTHDGDRRLRA